MNANGRNAPAATPMWGVYGKDREHNNHLIKTFNTKADANAYVAAEQPKESSPSEGGLRFYVEALTAMHGGRRHPKAAQKWTTTGRKVTLKDGSKRTLYKSSSKPGELRIRRMATRAGQTIATSVKPPR